MSNVKLINSSGLGAIIHTFKQSKQTLAIAPLQGIVKKLFQLTRMDEIISIADNLNTLPKA